jgi:CRP-like cAMP-binding protein
MVKIVRTTADGRQRVVRVLRPGDVAGLEALTGAHFGNDAVALTDVTVCRIPLSVIHELDNKSPRLHKSLMERWARSLKDADDWLADINFGTAHTRVSNLIKKMRNANDSEIVTIFSREDMGDMMDLKMETVSREISALVRKQIIQPLDKQGRVYRIVNKEMLQGA